LAWLLLGTKEADLWIDIKRRLDNSAALPWHLPLRSFLDDKGVEKQREKIACALKRIETTRIVALVAPDDLLNISRQETANSQEQTNISNIEHLFQRLNQQGTTLDGEELAYSMIKAYWPKLAGPIDDIPKLMPATRLVSLGIRAALSNESREQLPSGLGVSGILNMARKGDEKTTLVYNYIKDELGRGCNQIMSWLSTLSKSKIIAFRQCPKRLWLEVHKPELREDSADAQARFQGGYQVGDIAKRIYDPTIGFPVSIKEVMLKELSRRATWKAHQAVNHSR
jgi:hypothetical protein